MSTIKNHPINYPTLEAAQRQAAQLQEYDPDWTYTGKEIKIGSGRKKETKYRIFIHDEENEFVSFWGYNVG